MVDARVRESAAAAAALVGSTIADRYDILGVLGIGGMGAVYRARDRELDELVAFKVIRADLANVDAIVDRFRHEVKLARRVTHPNVARIFELGRAGDMTFCTMELIVGESLQRRLVASRRLPIAEAVAITSAVCDALTAAHAAGVIHRDIKPDNILIASDGRVVVADFGIASAQLAGDTDLAGTPAYMAPEQARGEPPTPAVDIYALGLVLHELITGRSAFPGTIAEVLAAKQHLERLELRAEDRVPSDLAGVIARATDRDPRRRIASAAELRLAIAPWVENRPIARPSRVGLTLGPDLRDVPTLIVLPPEAGVRGELMYLAEAVHEEVLAILGRLGGLRVALRGTSTDRDAAVLALHADRDVTATLHVADEPVARVVIRQPLALARIEQIAITIAATVTAELGLTSATAPSPASPALDALLQARHAARDIERAVTLFERAAILDPLDPRVAAGLAMARIRHMFYTSDDARAVLARARSLVDIALAHGSHLADAHLAAGYLELHVGEPRIAAGHFRVAIALAPHVADAHLWLGRLLLEAGFLKQGIARLEEAMAIAPRLAFARWDIARAWALEERWDDHDRVIAQIGGATGVLRDRVAGQARFASWRGDRAQLVAVRDWLRHGSEGVVFAPALLIAMISVHVGEPWAEHRDVIMAAAHDETPDRRRRAFGIQLAAEAAGAAGEVEVCMALVDLASEHGLFDLHWLDRCRWLAGIRAHPGYAAVHATTTHRAHAILDAFYGDHEIRATAQSPRRNVAADGDADAIDETAATELGD